MYMFGSVRSGRCGGEWGIGFSLGFTNPVGTGGVWDMCLCLGCGGVVVLGGVVEWPGPGFGRVGWSYVCVCCESGLCVYMTGPGICIVC